jgi:hypothetical protein
MHTRRPTAFRPASEPLEDRALMSTGSLIYASPQVGINSPVAPFAITGSASAPVEIFVASKAGPTPFLPVQDILIRTLTIDGRAVAGASIRANPVDTNGDGLRDAIITVPHASELHLAPGQDIVTFSAFDRFTVNGHPVKFLAQIPVTVATTLTQVQPYTTYVALSLGPNSGPLLNYTVAVAPGGQVSPPQRLTPGEVRNYQTGVGTGPHTIDVRIPMGNTIVFGDSMTSQSPATRPLYQLIYVGPRNIYRAQLVS